MVNNKTQETTIHTASWENGRDIVLNLCSRGKKKEERRETTISSGYGSKTTTHLLVQFSSQGGVFPAPEFSQLVKQQPQTSSTSSFCVWDTQDSSHWPGTPWKRQHESARIWAKFQQMGNKWAGNHKKTSATLQETWWTLGSNLFYLGSLREEIRQSSETPFIKIRNSCGSSLLASRRVFLHCMAGHLAEEDPAGLEIIKRESKPF